MPSSPFFREQLRGKDNFEVAGTDVATGVGYRVTVRRDSVDISAFSKIDPKKLASSIKTCLPVSIGASRYLIERSFAKSFLQAVKETGRISAVSITSQSQREIFTFIGDDPSKVADIFEVHVPSRLEWEQATLVEGSRDWGRKIGHAAKDLSSLRGKPVSVDIAYVADSSFLGHARKLGVYWSRREEMFARAIESYVEDELVCRGWRSDFLVMGTRAGYTRCRGLPYPIDAERMQINTAIAKLVATIARTEKWK